MLRSYPDRDLLYDGFLLNYRRSARAVISIRRTDDDELHDGVAGFRLCELIKEKFVALRARTFVALPRSKL